MFEFSIITSPPLPSAPGDSRASFCPLLSLHLCPIRPVAAAELLLLLLMMMMKPCSPASVDRSAGQASTPCRPLPPFWQARVERGGPATAVQGFPPRRCHSSTFPFQNKGALLLPVTHMSADSSLSFSFFSFCLESTAAVCALLNARLSCLLI